MKIIGLSDIHGNSAFLKKMNNILEAADVILLVGDITHFGNEKDALGVVSNLSHHSGKVFAVSGNCDFPDVDFCLNSCGINLHGKGEIYDGMGFVGVGGSLITPFHTPNEYTETEIENFLACGTAQIPTGLPHILVSHQPPVNTLCDQISSGDHVGSRAVRDSIEKNAPLVCFSGHIHESTGVDKIGDTYVINPGMLSRGGYAYAEIDETVKKIEIRSFS